MLGVAAVAGIVGWGAARIGSQKPEKQSTASAAPSGKIAENRYATLSEMEQVSGQDAS